MNIGSADTLNDNLAAAHLLTVLPIMCVFALTAKDKRLRVLAVVAAPFIVNTFILCNSRGATVGLAAGFLMAILAARTGYRGRMIGVAIAVSILFYVLADPQFIERQQTITDDDAGAERIETWQGASRLLMDHPLGVGGGGFEYLSPVYIPAIVEKYDGERRSVHNTYMLVATEWGIQGFLLYAGFLGTTFWMLHRVRRRSQGPDDFISERRRSGRSREHLDRRRLLQPIPG
jgi:O-antigen ligase